MICGHPRQRSISNGPQKHSDHVLYVQRDVRHPRKESEVTPCQSKEVTEFASEIVSLRVSVLIGDGNWSHSQAMWSIKINALAVSSHRHLTATVNVSTFFAEQ